MIQEIYNYLWTREQILKLSTDELIELTKENNNFPEMLKFVHTIMYRENILLLKEEYPIKIEKWLHNFRFSYTSNSEINEIINELIVGLQNYKNLTIKEKRNYISNWIAKEIIDRNLKKIYMSDDEIISYVLEDSTNLKIISESLGNKYIEINDPNKTIATYQMLRIQFTEIFEENREVLENSIKISNYISQNVKNKKTKRLANAYVKEVSYQLGTYYDQKIKKKEF